MISADDLLVIAAVVLTVAVLGVVAGGLALHAVRGASIWTSVAVVIGTATLVMASGVVAMSLLMLVSGDAFQVLLISVVAASAASGLVALALARRITRSSAALGEAAQRVGAGEPLTAPLDPDTRELRLLAEALRSASVRLAESRDRERSVEAARRELVAWVSHDLRSPVAALRAMAEALEDGVVADLATVADYHGRMRRETVRLGRMIDDLFELAAIHAGALVVTPRRSSLRDLVDEVLQSAEPLAAAKRLTLDADDVDDVVALVDPDQLARVARNLVANAIRHTPPGARVAVRCGVRDGTPYLEVADACGGIPEADLARLFEVGYRGEWARTPGHDVGAGLGLAIAKGIVDAHGGRLDVRNEDAGCTFTVTLRGVSRPATVPAPA
ncbi:MAG TPA: HAMP domain-containing sensor histidine kinase [Mycobacteriales bacterium]|nr:HAMP domain-containing sensor histidine kinase [Mycobacteriales bacterium]